MICLIDERFQEPTPKHTKFLAKWMRGLLVDCPTLQEAQRTIQEVGWAAGGGAVFFCTAVVYPPDLFEAARLFSRADKILLRALLGT